MNVLDLIYPPALSFVRGDFIFERGTVHSNCYKKLSWVQEPLCKRCGKPLTPGGRRDAGIVHGLPAQPPPAQGEL